MSPKNRGRKGAAREAARGQVRGNTWLARNSALVVVLLVLVFLAFVRFRVADVPLERDEGEFAYSGQLILSGIPPYSLAYSLKFPGTYYAYSVALALFGHTAWAVHIGLLIVNAATILILFFLARRILADNVAAAVTAIAYGFLSLDRWIMGIFGHATHLVVLAAMAGLLVLYHALDSKKALALIGAGMLLGLSVLMKQNGIFFFAFGAGLAAWSELRNTPRSFRGAIFRVGLVGAGGAIPFAILCGVFLAQGVLGNFLFWTFQYAREYVSEVSLSDAYTLFTSALTDITRANLLIWLLAAAGAILLWVVRWAAQTRIVLTAFLIVSFAAVCPGFYFREHYFILALPAVALFCGVAVLSIQQLLGYLPFRTPARAFAASLFVIAVVAYAGNERSYLFSLSMEELSRERYGANPFVEAPQIGKYIQAHSDPGDRIAVMGSEPEIYFYAQRKSATGYIYTYALMEEQRYSQQMQDEMISEITAAHPKFVVYAAISTSWLARKQERILTWTESYVNRCYTIVGIADIVSDTHTNWVWDADAVSYRPQSQNVVYIFRAKADGPCGGRL